MSKAKGLKLQPNQMDNNLNMIDGEEINPSIGNIDLTLLRRPITTSINGLEEVLKAYKDGTNELKKLLSKECDLIYECKVCRNIFRSLTNFISHKRVYCRNAFNPSDHFHFRNNGFVVQDVSAIIEAEQKINNNPLTGILPGNDEKSKDLSGVVEHILWKQHQYLSNNVSDVLNQINFKNHSEDVNKAQQTLILNPVKETDVAVYQSLQTETTSSNMEDEVKEVHNMLKNSNSTLGPDGKIINELSSRGVSSPTGSTKCKVCNIHFETVKTLKLHLEMKHLSSSYVYQCPSCSQKFSTSAAVLKHLSNDHKKSNRKIRLMRDSIIKKRVRADEAIVKCPSKSRELQQLKLSNSSEQNTTNSNYSEWNIHNFKADNDIDDSYICPSCLKKFDRKAVYTSHVQMCSDIKDREQEKLKKRKAKDGAKIKQMNNVSLESEDNSNISENSSKHKRKRIPKVKTEEEEKKIEFTEENSEDIVDWNLDDEEENKKLENIKKEIIEDEYKKNLEATPIKNFVKDETSDENILQEQLDDDDENGLIIDEKMEENFNHDMKCPTCDKVFPTSEKLKYHLTFYHSRQKRFKCKMCEYQGYRKKDTMNHINFVHGENVTLETLNNYTETVSKAVNEEDVKKQNELKKNQLRIKRKMARERLRKKASDAKVEQALTNSDMKTENLEQISSSEKEKSVESSEKVNDLELTLCSRKSTLYDTSLVDDSEYIIKMTHRNISPKKDDLDDNSDDNQFKESAFGQSSKSSSIPNITRFGKIIKSIPSMDILDSSQSSRPIRNRIKPVRKDFLYDLSDLLKKEADAYRDQSSTVTVKRELRKRAMSTHTRETPSINSFDQSLKKLTEDSFVQPLSNASVSKEEDLTHKCKDQRNRRMSVFIPPTRSMFPPQPRSPPYRPPATHKNAGAAYKMALKEFDNNRASLYEPKFLWTICFEQENDKSTLITNSSNVSTASSILQKLSGNIPRPEIKLETPTDTSSSLTAEQLCKKFELINVTNMNELDIPVSNTINLSPGASENNLMSLTLDETENNACAESSDDGSDAKIEIGNKEDKAKLNKKYKKKLSRKQAEKRKSVTINQRRLTVMQRLQENKIRKSREQLFQRLINQQTEEDSSEFNLFTES